MHWTFVSLLVRSGIILGAAEILRRFPRRAPAAYRHRIVLGAFGMLAAWPVLSAAIPMISLPVWPQVQLRDIVTVQQTILIFSRGATTPHIGALPVLIWIAGALFTLLPIALGQ